jgi:hypothetical protein
VYVQIARGGRDDGGHLGYVCAIGSRGGLSCASDGEWLLAVAAILRKLQGSGGPWRWLSGGVDGTRGDLDYNGWCCGVVEGRRLHNA